MGKLAEGQAPPLKKRRKRRAAKSAPKHPPGYCAICGEWCERPTKHHLSYEPEIVTYVHRSCHDRMHGRPVFNDPITRRMKQQDPVNWRATAPMEFAVHVVAMYVNHRVEWALGQALAVRRSPGNGNGNGTGSSTVH